MPEINKLESLILNLHEAGMIKFGQFTLKSGKSSCIYADIRTAISYPEIFRAICDFIYSKITGLNYQFICGVPYSALTFASAVAYTYKIPMLLKRKEAKGYGTKKIIEGDFQPGDICLIIEDVISTGLSITETTVVLEQGGLKIKDVITFIDRNLGGREQLARHGYTLHNITDLYQIITVLWEHGRISADEQQYALALMGGDDAAI